MPIVDRDLKLRAALVQAVRDANMGIPFGVQNSDFSKPTDGSSPWAFVYYIPNIPSVATLGDAGEDAVDGLLQIDLNYPLRQGEGAVLQMSSRLASFFTAGKGLTYEDVKVKVLGCGHRPGREEDGWWRVSVRVTWSARVPRN